MNGHTHLLAGAGLALALHATAPQLVLVSVGAMLPDLDTVRLVRGPYERLIPDLLPHRGPTHSLLMLAGAVFVHPWLGLGVLTHLILDMATASGVQLFWPYHRKYRLPFARSLYSGGTFDRILGLLLLAAVLLLCQHSLGNFFTFDPAQIREWLDSLRGMAEKLRP